MRVFLKRLVTGRAPAMALLAATAAGAATGTRYAVDARFAAQPFTMQDMPVVLTGADLYRLAGAVRPAIAGLRVQLNGTERPCQVDERNGTGRPAGTNGILDPDDELSFYLDFEPGKATTLTLSWSDGLAQPEGAGPGAAASAGTGVRTRTETEVPYVELWAETERFRLGMNAEGLDDTTEHRIGNYGRAAFSVLEFEGKRLTDITSAWSNVIPAHPFGYGEAENRWSALQVMERGPVRTLITTECPGHEDGVRAVFTVYGRGPAVDVSYELRYRRLEAEERPQALAFRYPMRLGEKPDANDVLLVPVAGGTHRGRLTAADLTAFYPTHYETPLPEEGWFAWVDVVEHVGLAVFFEDMSAVRERAEWVDSRPVSNPHVRIRTIPGGRPDNTVTWQRRSVHTARVWECRNRLVGLRTDDEAWVRWAYRLWAESLEELADVALPRVIPEP